MAINDVLPLKAARRCVIANVECFWGPGHQRPNFDGCIYIRYAAPVALPYSGPFICVCLAKFGWVPFVDLRVQRLATKQNTEFTKGPILTRGPMFMKFWDNGRDSSCFLTDTVMPSTAILKHALGNLVAPTCSGAVASIP